MSLILGHVKRKLIRDIVLQDADGSTVVPGVNDVVRVKVGRIGQTPLLDLDSAAPSANGSTISKDTPSAGYNRVEIVQKDMETLSVGIYSFEVALVDNADAQAIKHVEHQILCVQGTQTGDVGIA